LDRLNREFLNFLERHPMAVVSLVETKSTAVGQLGMQFKLVEPSSAGTLILNSFVKANLLFQL
jgi:hypothetical protein